MARFKGLEEPILARFEGLEEPILARFGGLETTRTHFIEIGKL